MKKTVIRIICIVAAALLVFGTIAACFAEEINLIELTDSTVVATVGGEDVLWSDVKDVYDELVSAYGSYYDLTDPVNEALFRAVAAETIVDEKMTALHANSYGLQLTDEEKAAKLEEADTMWEGMLDDYVDYNYSDATDEEKATARTEAENYYKEEYGYTKEYVENYYLTAAPGEKLRAYLVKDITVSDEEVTSDRETTVTADKALYENDLESYCTAVSSAEFMAYYMYMYTGTYSAPEYPAYKPAGFRKVKQILISVDDALLDDYTDKQAAYEEQQEESDEDTETTDDTTETTEEPTTPVTEADIAAAEAAILASVAETVEEINTRYAAGESFDDLAKAYSIDSADAVYEICDYTTNYVESFVKAGMAIEKIGELSAPAISNYGVHILLYTEDVPAGPVELTTDEFESLRSEMLTEKQDAAYDAACEAFEATVVVTYNIPTTAEVEAIQDAANDDEDDAEEADDTDDTEDAEYEIVIDE